MINTSLRQLRAFVAVAQYGGFSRAAPTLFLTQSALTSAVRELESALGAPLFDRTTRQVELTAFGQDFLPTAQRLLQDMDVAWEDARAAARGEKGHVRIAAGLSMVTTFLPPAIVQFSARFPHVKVHVRDDNGDGINRRVERAEVDIGLSGKFGDNPALAFEPLFVDAFGIVCHRQHPLATQRPRPGWKDLTAHRYIASSQDTTVHSTLARAMGDADFFLRPMYEASSLTALESLLEAGLGFAVLTALAASHNPQRNLVFIRLSRPAVTREVCLITRAGRHLSPAAAAFRDILLGHIARCELPGGTRRTLAKRSRKTER
jgi:DNA-binding transcriptional LysR family regulator